MKRTLTVAALAAALAVPAAAQQKPMNSPAATEQPSAGSTQSQTTSAQQPGFLKSQSQSEWRGSKLIGASIYGPDNNSIGLVNDLIIGGDGQIKAAVIGVGGFLGVGQKEVAVPFQALNVKRMPDSASIDRVLVSYTKDQLNNAPTFAYFQPPARTPQTTGSGAGYPRPSGTPTNR